MKRTKALRTSLAIGSALALSTAGVVVAEAHSSKVAKKIRIAKLPGKTQKVLRRAGVVGPTLNLVGTPNLAGTQVEGLSLYHAPWAKGGECVSGVVAGKVDGADCDPALFSPNEPGYATAGPFGTATATNGELPPITIQQVYGVATAAVKTARLIGPKSGKTNLPVAAGTAGFVVFGSANPPADGNFVELLSGAGKVVQRIQIAP